MDVFHVVVSATYGDVDDFCDVRCLLFLRMMVDEMLSLHLHASISFFLFCWGSCSMWWLLLLPYIATKCWLVFMMMIYVVGLWCCWCILLMDHYVLLYVDGCYYWNIDFWLMIWGGWYMHFMGFLLQYIISIKRTRGWSFALCTCIMTLY